MVLADWRLSLSPKNAVTLVTGKKENDSVAFCGVIAFQTTRSDGSLQQVVHESGAVTPFPINKDDVVLVAMMTLSHLAGHPEILQFDVPHVIALLRWPENTHSRKKIDDALKRFKAMDSQFDGVWYDRKDRSTTSYNSGIIAEISVVKKRGRPQAGQRLCRLQWTAAFRQSLLNGNLLNINLELLSQFKSHAGAQYYRHLNKVWHSGNKIFIMSVIWKS